MPETPRLDDARSVWARLRPSHVVAVFSVIGMVLLAFWPEGHAAMCGVRFLPGLGAAP